MAVVALELPRATHDSAGTLSHGVRGYRWRRSCRTPSWVIFRREHSCDSVNKRVSAGLSFLAIVLEHVASSHFHVVIVLFFRSFWHHPGTYLITLSLVDETVECGGVSGLALGSVSLAVSSSTPESWGMFRRDGCCALPIIPCACRPHQYYSGRTTGTVGG